MNKLLILLVFLFGCSTPPLPPPQDNINYVLQEETKENKVINAWKDTENGEIVSALEKVETKYWIYNFTNDVILLDIHNSNFEVKYRDSIYFKISIFIDGTLFLDTTERKVSVEHREKLIKLFIKLRGF